MEGVEEHDTRPHLSMCVHIYFLILFRFVPLLTTPPPRRGRRRHHPPSHKLNYNSYLRDAAGLFLDGDLVVQGKALVAGFFCVCAIAQTVIGPSFNPFTPVHTAVYTMTGVPNPDAVAADPAADKPKED